MAHYFTKRGFAFFIPHRRGHGDSTGVYYADFVDSVAGKDSPAGKHAMLLAYLQDQTYEVSQAIEYLTGLKNSAKKLVIDSNKIAIVGHSFGGMVTLFSNNILTAHNAAVDIAGASESWDAFDNDDGALDDCSTTLDWLKNAVRGANKPIFFLEPKNDASIRPTVVLSKVAGDANERYQAAIYGPVPLDPDEDSKDAHRKFVTQQDQIEKWGPAVIEFLARYGVK
jgi:predicted dienelactone hydrolase